MTKRWVAVVLIALAIGTAAACADDDAAPPSTGSAAATDEPVATASSEASEATLATLAAGQESCGYTADATQGPYYVSGTRALEDGNLNYDDFEGTPIKIAGYVYGSNENADPVSGAKIEIWHADDTGAYHPQGQGPASDYGSDEISLRGYVTTNDDGYYEFASIFPGEYEGRVRHVHVRVSADGHQPLVSQIITALPGDHVSPEQDMISSDLPRCQVVDFTDRDGVKTAAFNFHIR